MPFISLIYVVCNVKGIKLGCDKGMILGKATPFTVITQKVGKTKIMVKLKKKKKIRGVKKKQPRSHVLL